jgi:TP901-1 family phage major tail protein
MAAQKGSDLLIKSGDGASPEVFTGLAGLKTKSLKISGETVDITNQDSTNKMRELLDGAGITSMSVSGAGVFKDATGMQTINTRVKAKSINNYQVIIPGFGTYEGAFQATELTFAGEHNGELTYDVAFESAGDIAFTAV